MPKLGDVEKLKEIVDSLGNEKEIRRERGEKIADVAPPEQTISASDMADLLGQPDDSAAAAALTGEIEPTEEAQIDDISRLLEETGEAAPASEETMGLDVLPDSFGEEAGADAQPGSGEEMDASAVESFDLPDFSGAESAMFTEEPVPVPETEMSAGEPEDMAMSEPEQAMTEPPATEETAASSTEPTFDLSDFQISDVPGDSAFGAADQLFESAPETPLSAAPDAPAEMGEGTPVDMDSFELPDFGALGGDSGALADVGEPAAEEETADAGPDFSGLGDQLFDLPDSGGASDFPGGEAETPPAGDSGSFSSFEMPDLSEIGGEAEGEPPLEEPSLDTEPVSLEGDDGLDQLDTGEFALPEFGKDYTPPVEPAAPLEEPALKTPAGAGFAEGAPAAELAGADREAQYSQRDFENIKSTLVILPLNLKIIVEELIGDSGLRGPMLKRLLDALIAGEAPKAIASIVSTITGQKIILPKSFEKQSGLAFEREKGSFAYFLRTKGLKAAVAVTAAIAVLIVLGFGAYRFVFRPLLAMPVYDEGFQAIKQDLYEKARQKFDEASRIWDSKDQYYRYAEAFMTSAAGNYRYADQMYQNLLRRYPGDVKGIIDYARLETLRRNFTHSEKLLVDDLLKRDMYNFEALAACADNYLAWAEDDPAKIKDADYYYTTLAEHYRDKTAAHLKKLEFLVRSERLARAQGNADTDNTNNVLAYVAFLRRKGWDVIDPAVYTETAEYLIDKNETDDVPDLLDKAKAADPGYAPAWYETARWFRLLGERDQERRALERAIDLFKKPEPATGRNFQLAAELRNSLERTAKLILASNRLGEFFIEEKQAERAEDLLLDAQRLYEQSADKLKRTRYASGGQFGRVYYNLGNIALGSGNFGRALDLYAAAERNGFSSPDQTYKKGFVRYQQKDYAEALVEFHRANTALPDNEAVLFALATTEYRRFQYQIAEGYYLYLVRILGKRKDALPEINVDTNPTHLDLITNLYIAYNNLGCTYFKQSNDRDVPQRTEATNYLQKASELYDVVSRDPANLARLEETTIAARVGKKEIVKGKGLEARYLKAPAPFYNLDVIFHGKADSVVLGEKIDVLVYDLVPRDLASPQLLSTELTGQ